MPRTSATAKIAHTLAYTNFEADVLHNGEKSVTAERCMRQPKDLDEIFMKPQFSLCVPS